MTHQTVAAPAERLIVPSPAALADEVAAARLTPACAHWLKTGERID
jgi:hypothetical protein